MSRLEIQRDYIDNVKIEFIDFPGCTYFYSVLSANDGFRRSGSDRCKIGRVH